MTDSTRVLLIPESDGSVLAIRDGGAVDDSWLPLATQAMSTALPFLARAFGSENAGGVSARRFAMHPDDLASWDTLRRFGNEGYSFGTLWGDRGFAKNCRFGEVAPAATSFPSGVPPFDPATLAIAVVVAEIRSMVAELQKSISAVAADVKSILEFLRLEQEAQVLAAKETVDEVYARLESAGVVGDVDWDRIAALEQVLKAQHRQVIGELQQVIRRMAFTDLAGSAEAKSVVSVERVDKLVALAEYQLMTFLKWSEIMLVAKQQRDEADEAVRERLRDLLRSYAADVRDTLARSQNLPREIEGRSSWKRLWSDGLVRGALKDDNEIRVAQAWRTTVKESLSPNRLPRPARPAVARIDGFTMPAQLPVDPA